MEKAGITIKSSLLIIDAGSFSTEIDELARFLGYTDIAFLDDKLPVAIGTTQDIGKMRERYDTAIVALGNNENRKRFHEELVRHDFNIPSAVLLYYFEYSLNQSANFPKPSLIPIVGLNP